MAITGGPETAGVLCFVVLLAVIVGVFVRARSLRALIIVGAVMLLGLVGPLMLHSDRGDDPNKSLVGVLLASVMFLYLWWLAALIFDLSFAWHHYIRNSKVSRRVKKCFEGAHKAMQEAAAKGEENVKTG